MEIIREYGIWRQVRDPDGIIGWMNKSLLTGERTGYVTGGIRTLYTSPDLQSRVAWRIEPGTVVTITLCENVWCRDVERRPFGLYPAQPDLGHLPQ